jgi:hypothetical protein
MPLFLLFMGLLAIITAVKGNTSQVASQIEADFTGAGSFWYWIGAILILAVVGRALGLPEAAKMLIGLILAVYLLSQPGLWAKGVAALNVSAPAAAPSQDVGAATTATGQTPIAVGSTGATATASQVEANNQTMWDALTSNPFSSFGQYWNYFFGQGGASSPTSAAGG